MSRSKSRSSESIFPERVEWNGEDAHRLRITLGACTYQSYQSCLLCSIPFTPPTTPTHSQPPPPPSPPHNVGPATPPAGASLSRRPQHPLGLAPKRQAIGILRLLAHEPGAVAVRAAPHSVKAQRRARDLVNSTHWVRGVELGARAVHRREVPRTLDLPQRGDVLQRNEAQRVGSESRRHANYRANPQRSQRAGVEGDPRVGGGPGVREVTATAPSTSLPTDGVQVWRAETGFLLRGLAEADAKSTVESSIRVVVAPPILYSGP